MDSHIFDTYEKEFKNLISQLEKDISSIKSSNNSNLHKNKIKRDFEEADEILGQLETELMALPPQQKAQNSSILRNYKETLKKLRKDFNLLGVSERDQLLGTAYVDIPSNSQRTRLLSGTQKLEEASKRLDDAHRIALETENIGISTLGDLHRQRDQIERTRDGLTLADSWIAKSQGLLKSMQRKY